MVLCIEIFCSKKIQSTEIFMDWVLSIQTDQFHEKILDLCSLLLVIVPALTFELSLTIALPIFYLPLKLTTVNK